MHIPTEIVNRGGLAATFELLRAGATSHGLARAVARGEVVRIRQGWYGLPTAEPLPTEAVRVGGRLTCVSGARHYGLWVSRTDILHIRVPSKGSRLRSRHDKDVRLNTIRTKDTCIHWGPGRPAGTRFSLLPRGCLRDMAYCQKPERVIAAADSAIRAGHLTRAQWLRDLAGMPRRLRRLLARIDAQSESITESITRFRLQQLGYEPRVQVRIPGVGRVDLLLGDRLVIELDGWEFHKSREAFEEDRRRDALLAARGYRVLRFTYRQVTRRWHEVLGAIRRCVELGHQLAS